MKLKGLLRCAVPFGSMFALGLVASSALAQPYTVVMSGLDNPRGLAFAPNGALYVAEAGVGGRDSCAFNGAGEKRCLGLTGAITRLWKGQQSRIVEGLPSHAVYDHPNPVLFPNGSSASGPNDISFTGTGGAYITIGLGGGPEFAELLGSEDSGTLIHMAASGKWKVVTDVALYEFEENPAGGALDSNPYGVLAEPGGRIVVDAGGNALLGVAPNGTVETLAVFPPRLIPTFLGLSSVESVPTSVARGPDGALYVGELTGFPFPGGYARIQKVVLGEPPETVCDGFRAIIDIAFAPDGSLYVVENATNAFPPPPPFAPNAGRLSRVDLEDCTITPLLEGLNRPTSVVVGPDGAIYVTNNGVTADIGEVLRLVP